MSTSEDATEQKKSEDRPRSSRFRQTSAHIDHLSVGKYDKFRGTTSTISTFQQKIQKKRGKIRSECTSISDVVYLGCICICISVLLWHKPIKPRLIGHVKWRNRARTQVWHFIIISTASAAPTLYRVYQSGPVSHDRSICICIFLYFCIFSEWVSAPEMLFDR